jgi:SsrA-binding protein
MSEGIKIIATNRKARHDYHIEEKFEAGMMLTGSEVKSLRDGKVNMTEAFCRVERGEVFVFNCHIAAYEQGGYAEQEPLRKRKLLLHRREIAKLDKAVGQKGYTIIPLRMYFRNSYAKLEIGLGRGKKQHDKRADIAAEETRRRLKRVMSERNA